MEGDTEGELLLPHPVCQPDDVKALGKILVKDDGFCCNQFLQEVN